MQSRKVERSGLTIRSTVSENGLHHQEMIGRISMMKWKPVHCLILATNNHDESNLTDGIADGIANVRASRYNTSQHPRE